jgi:RNA polymerase sigma factor (sigma-70 family)
MGKLSMLTEEEERKLAGGSPADLQRLVEGNLRLVIAVAKRYRDQGVSQEDLIQEGNLGLMVAAKRWKPDPRARFSTYAWQFIGQEMKSAIRRERRRIPTVSLTQQFEDGEQFEKDVEYDSRLEEAAAAEEILTQVDQLLRRQATDSERAIFQARAYLGETVEEVGKSVGVTRQRVQQIEDKLRTMIKKKFNS